MACSKVISDFEVLSADDTGRRRDRSDAEKIRIVEESFRGRRLRAPPPGPQAVPGSASRGTIWLGGRLANSGVLQVATISSRSASLSRFVGAGRSLPGYASMACRAGRIVA